MCNIIVKRINIKKGKDQKEKDQKDEEKIDSNNGCPENVDIQDENGVSVYYKKPYIYAVVGNQFKNKQKNILKRIKIRSDDFIGKFVKLSDNIIMTTNPYHKEGVTLTSQLFFADNMIFNTPLEPGKCYKMLHIQKSEEDQAEIDNINIILTKIDP